MKFVVWLALALGVALGLLSYALAISACRVKDSSHLLMALSTTSLFAASIPFSIVDLAKDSSVSVEIAAFAALSALLMFSAWISYLANVYG